jgi:hypothetical protein
VRRLSLKAAIIGGIVDILSTYLLVVVAVFVFILVRGFVSAGHPPPQDLNDMVLRSVQSGPIHMLLICLGCLCSVLGGYVAARIAKHDELVNGAASAWLCVLIGLFGFASAQDGGQIVRHIASEVAAPLLGLFGGYIRLFQKGPQPATAPQ